MTHPFFAGARHPRVLAHRGWLPATEEPSVWENTAASFAAAHAAGAEYIETDCRLTADGEVVLFHDETMQRLTGDPRPISEVRHRELERIFADHGGLLSVAAALDAFPETRFNIDVKTAEAAAPLGALVAAHTERVLVTSFSDRDRRAALQATAAAGATMPPATSGGRSVIARLRAATAVGLSPAGALRDVDAVQIPVSHRGIRLFTPALVRAAHRLDVEVHVWTVNDPAEMRRLVEAGADGIVTDRTELALDALN
ncbi:glycerophosphodiester phosphodiesterase family protein [Microbacterium sp. USHLN186]|uniref:glycerophosphodiester phosphodiesterase family protein n=1 Tax=Microbacterium sp. USHLN186 TaxID=3081286 RepID=UPI003016145C